MEYFSRTPDPIEIPEAINRLNDAKADRVPTPVAGNLVQSDASGNPVITGIPAADAARKVPSPAAGNLVAQDALGNPADGGPYAIVPCACVYDAATSTHALAKQFPSQRAGDFFVAAFVPDHDYTAGDRITFEGAQCRLRYDDTDLPVQSGAFRAGLCKTLNFHKMDGGGDAAL